MRASHESADFVAVDETLGCDACSRSNDSRYLLIHFLQHMTKNHTWIFCPEVLTKLLSREIPAIP